eukprot:5707885-Heterocapsa_arctica.AAC.1
MQTIDGDEFISDKECIRLLYCNKGRWGYIDNHYDLMHPTPQQDKGTWGDIENHYDLMHPTPQQDHTGQTYNRRSESQQTDHEQMKANICVEQQKHTKFGEQQTTHNGF